MKNFRWERSSISASCSTASSRRSNRRSAETIEKFREAIEEFLNENDLTYGDEGDAAPP